MPRAKKDEMLTLRPEGTASCVRACLQHRLIDNQAQQRLWYQGPMFRYEQPQEGRQRQFHQFGVETFGMASADIDAELILIAYRLWQRLGLDHLVSLEINSIGSLQARNDYKAALVEYLTPYKDRLDEDSQRRLDTNPLRILDSKSEETQRIIENAPRLGDFLDDESKQHFSQLCALLDKLGINYHVNEGLVRGLDYYNKTVFEWVTNALGAQGTVCAGGRYDGLVEQLGGKATPAIGFAIGLERLTILLQRETQIAQSLTTVDVYLVAVVDENQYPQVFEVAEQLRQDCPNLKMISHCGGGSFKSQMKKADKSGARFAMIIGSNELEEKTVSLKPLRGEFNHDQQSVAIADLAEKIKSLL